MVGILVSFSDGLFSGAMLVLGRVPSEEYLRKNLLVWGQGSSVKWWPDASKIPTKVTLLHQHEEDLSLQNCSNSSTWVFISLWEAPKFLTNHLGSLGSFRIRIKGPNVSKNSTRNHMREKTSCKENDQTGLALGKATLSSKHAKYCQWMM